MFLSEFDFFILTVISPLFPILASTLPELFSGISLPCQSAYTVVSLLTILSLSKSASPIFWFFAQPKNFRPSLLGASAGHGSFESFMLRPFFTIQWFIYADVSPPFLSNVTPTYSSLRYILYVTSLSLLSLIEIFEFKFTDSCSTVTSLPFLSFTTLKSLLISPPISILSPLGVLRYFKFEHSANIYEESVIAPAFHLLRSTLLIPLW